MRIKNSKIEIGNKIRLLRSSPFGGLPRNDTFLRSSRAAAKQSKLIIFLPLLLFFIAPLAQAATFTSTVTGNWNDGATWGNASPGAEGTDYPGPNDGATIANTYTVSVPTSSTVQVSTITVQNGGKLQLWEGTTLKVNKVGGVTVNSGGIFNINGSSASVSSITSIDGLDSYFFTISGTLNMNYCNMTKSSYLTLSNIFSINNSTITATLYRIFLFKLANIFCESY